MNGHSAFDFRMSRGSEVAVRENPNETRITKSEMDGIEGASGFGLLSVFGFRHSDFTWLLKQPWLAHLLPSLITDDVEHRFGIRGLLEGLSKFGLMEELGNIRQRMKMFLKLALGHEEKHHQVHRLIIERIKIYPFFRPAQ